jgi:hypothetical protein
MTATSAYLNQRCRTLAEVLRARAAAARVAAPAPAVP